MQQNGLTKVEFHVYGTPFFLYNDLSFGAFDNSEIASHAMSCQFFNFNLVGQHVGFTFFLI